MQVDVIPNDADGVVDLDAMAAMVDERVRLVSFTVVASLRRAGINTTAPNRVASHLGARGLDSVVRAGVHYFNTTDELQRLCEHVQSIASTRETS